MQEYLSGCQQQGTAEMGRAAESFQSIFGHMTAAPAPLPSPAPLLSQVKARRALAAVRTRGIALDCFKCPVKRTDGRKSRIQCNLRNALPGCTQQFFCLYNPLVVQVFMKRHVHALLENPCKMVPGKSAHPGNLIQGNRLLVTLVDIVARIHNDFHIFLLFSRVAFTPPVHFRQPLRVLQVAPRPRNTKISIRRA